jgi:hypothetical protein
VIARAAYPASINRAKSLEYNGAPEKIRTPNLLIRSLTRSAL